MVKEVGKVDESSSTGATRTGAVALRRGSLGWWAVFKMPATIPPMLLSIKGLDLLSILLDLGYP